ncbi:hypothetical protein V8E55_008876 [Tylopilus felleus]
MVVAWSEVVLSCPMLVGIVIVLVCLMTRMAALHPSSPWYITSSPRPRPPSPLKHPLPSRPTPFRHVHYSHPLLPTLSMIQNLPPLSTLKDVIHEGFRRWSVRYYLAPLRRTRVVAGSLGLGGGGSGIKVHVAFEVSFSFPFLLAFASSLYLVTVMV